MELPQTLLISTVAVSDDRGDLESELFTLINLDEDSSKKHPFPCPTTYRTALSHYVEITALPRTHILKVGTNNHSHREK